MWPPARRGHKGLRPGGNAEGWSRGGVYPLSKDRFYCAEIVKRLLNDLSGGDKPLPYVNCNVIAYF
jgi:hypothetical protein